MTDCPLPPDIHEPTPLELAYIAAARGRIYFARYGCVLLEPGTGGRWHYTVVGQHAELATAAATGLPTAPSTYPRLDPPLGDGSIAGRAVVAMPPGTALPWIPVVTIVRAGGARLAHGWIPTPDVATRSISVIAANSIRYSAEVARCARAAAADRAAQDAAADAAAAMAEEQRRRALLATMLGPMPLPSEPPPLDVAKGGVPESPVSSGIGLAIGGTILALAVVGAVVWAAE